MTERVQDRLARVQDRMRVAAFRVGRDPSSVKLVAVSKTMPVGAILEVLDAGVAILGENRVQEAAGKIAQLPGRAAWHLVGHLQTNKAKLAAQLFETIHSLDSLRLAQELDRQCRQSGRIVQCLVEVNLGAEGSKSGLPEEGIRPLLEAGMDFPNLRVEGLMAIPPFLEDPEAVRPFFRRLRILRDKLETEGWRLPELSMGMTHDYEVAIEEGATMVRIGTAIFGPRPA